MDCEAREVYKAEAGGDFPARARLGRRLKAEV